MPKNKTTETEGSVADFINKVADTVKRNDCYHLVELITTQTGLPAKMWGSAIVGFGRYHYQYDSGHEGDAPLIGFSPRANALVLYMDPDFARREELLQSFGKHKQGKACIYIKKLADVEEEVLKELITDSVEHMKSVYGA
ncbi:DUF1801 domain-containing protein [Mucilaginibacter terrae]|uniref:DUF1801 domain-containing protein n=1 Tax=Mucilaginibacter terrae TaxID=1955052 RepID=UPI00363AEF6F